MINLDGFNEVALAAVDNRSRGVYPHYPRTWFDLAGGLEDTRAVAAAAAIRILRQRRAGLAAHQMQSWTRFSVLANFIWLVRDRRLEQEVAVQQSALHSENDRALRYQIRGPSRQGDSEAEFIADLAEVWANSSMQMAHLARANGGRYVHLLQPNQYVEGSKPMGPEEAAIAFRTKHPYRKWVGRGYPALLEAGARLRAGGVDFHDLTGVFAQEPRPTYRDRCCHFNTLGNTIIAGRIARIIDADEP